ncbi:MAG: DUF4328 domain-containing protein, partial [Sciscionella sp.]
GVSRPPPTVAPRPYRGPPSYPAPPRWGFPRLAWRWPTSLPGAVPEHPDPERALRSVARATVVVLVLAATVLGLAAGGEIWRYVLVVRSLSSTVSAAVLSASDALLDTAAILGLIGSGAALILGCAWLLRARRCANVRTLRRAARPAWQVVLGVLVPGLNLVLPFAVLAELEHAALRGEDGPLRPSALLHGWWITWLAGGTVFAVTLGWNFRTGLRELAQGVLWHAATDLGAAALAILSLLVVRRLTLLLAKDEPSHLARRVVLRLDGVGPLRPTSTRVARPRWAPR